MVTFNTPSGMFTLHTDATSYQMKVDQNRVLLHTYYGPRLRDSDLSYRIQYKDRGFSPNPWEEGHNRIYSLDTLPQEYSTCGVGDFRLPSLELETADGSRLADLRYTGFAIRPGKYALKGLPAFYAAENEADTLVLFLEDAAAKVTVELYYGVLEAYDLITRAVRIVNHGDAAVRLRRAASVCLDFQRSDLDFITLDGAYALERLPRRAALRPGTQSVDSVRGASSHQHNPFVVLCDHDANEDHGLCFGAMLLYSGNFEAAAERSQYEDTRLVMGIHPYHFCCTLEPGEAFTTPEAALICSAEGLTGMSRQFHRAIRTHLRRDHFGRKPVLINSWEGSYFNFNTDTLVKLAKEAAALGIELFVMDDGWFGHRNNDRSSLGDWWVNEEKLPGGMKALAEQLGALGMKLGFWIEPEMVSEDSDLYRAHPDWVLCAPGRNYTRGRSQLVLDLTRPEVRDHVYHLLTDVLDSAPISYLKWDMNRSLTQVWSAGLPAQRQGEVYHRYVLGVYDLLERFRQNYPHILIEGCCGGGGRFDGGMLYYTPQIWCSDNTDAIDRLYIQHGTSLGYPTCAVGAHVSACPNAQNGRTVSLQTRGTVAMSGAFGYELDLGKLSQAEKDEIARQIQFYKAHYDLIHQGDYYRLAGPDGPYTAWAHVSADKKEALVCVVTGTVHYAAPFRFLRLKGLDPSLNYSVNGTVYAGDVLMHSGYPLPILRDDYQTLQLYLKAK